MEVLYWVIGTVLTAARAAQYPEAAAASDPQVSLHRGNIVGWMDLREVRLQG